MSSIEFLKRHIGIPETDRDDMLKYLGYKTLDDLINAVVPPNIRRNDTLNSIPEALDEYRYLEEVKKILSHNQKKHNLIGMGYYNTILPSVIKRNILENPGWYTQYTPYQSEIAQGRLEALINFQTMISDLTGLPISNASLLDEATAVAEGMCMVLRKSQQSHTKTTIKNKFFVSKNCFPQTIDVLTLRASALAIDLIIDDPSRINYKDNYLGVILQNPDVTGHISDFTEMIESLHKHNTFVIMAVDLLSLTLIKTPGDMKVDIAVGSAQRFGIPLGYGGPHPAFLACDSIFQRNMPGRIIGISKTKEQEVAYRISLQTREQHIRRDKATSNICTSQVLLAVISSMYAIYHGSEGLYNIAHQIHQFTCQIAYHLKTMNFTLRHDCFFDTLYVEHLSPEELQKIQSQANQMGYNLRYMSDAISFSLDETIQQIDVENIITIFSAIQSMKTSSQEKNIPSVSFPSVLLSGKLIRQSRPLQHSIFNKYHTEIRLMRYIKRLETKDLSLVHSMIPLGSCTMKLNAATELYPISWPETSNMHPFMPTEQVQGYTIIIAQFKQYLADILGLPHVSLQPNSGAQGEYTGLMVIREYFHDKQETNRNIVLIPASAHGTNPASAVMAGMQVVIIRCTSQGAIDIIHLTELIQEYQSHILGLMVTYPSTHGVFEKEIQDICKMVHDVGGKVYLDGANMNAQVGLVSPGLIGVDVCHVNLHKTFAIPHGGGGPGMGPIAVSAELGPYLPQHSIMKEDGNNTSKGIHAVSASHYGSASIILISYAYMRLLGGRGLTEASKYAILNANYLKKKLETTYKILYSDDHGRVAHEFIIDLRDFKKEIGIDVEDIAKRLMDYSFHAPTVSWPVPGTMMIEPTESESKEELDRFCEALISIYAELQKIQSGAWDAIDNPLKNAPHTQHYTIRTNWDHPYSREEAVYPLPYLKQNKFWPSVSRIDSVYGDRNLFCVCADDMLSFETSST